MPEELVHLNNFPVGATAPSIPNYFAELTTHKRGRSATAAT
jgi:hypothetical protein